MAERRLLRPTPLVITAGLLLVVLLVALGYFGWQYGISNAVAAGRHDHALQRLDGRFPDPATAQDHPGDAWGVLRIPAFGEDWRMPLITGDDDQALASGVATHPVSTLPGENGNLILLGHRATHGEPFRRLPDLVAGDQIIVETRDAIHTYVLDTAPQDLTVRSEAGWVLDPKPGHPGEPADRPFITLITNQDLWPTGDRTVAFGHLASSTNK